MTTKTPDVVQAQDGSGWFCLVWITNKWPFARCWRKWTTQDEAASCCGKATT